MLQRILMYRVVKLDWLKERVKIALAEAVKKYLK